MSEQKDPAVAFICWSLRIIVAAIALLLIFGLWRSARAEVTETEIDIECKAGKCTLDEAILKRLLVNNNRATVEVLRLRKRCGDVEV